MKIQHLLIIVLFTLYGCTNISGCGTFGENTEDTMVWITKHKHPIIVTVLKQGANGVDNDKLNITNYQLLSDNKEYFITGYTFLILPDTIK